MASPGRTAMIRRSTFGSVLVVNLACMSLVGLYWFALRGVRPVAGRCCVGVIAVLASRWSNCLHRFFRW